MPAATVEPAAIDIVELPAPVIDVGLKPMVTPEGWPVAESVIADLKPPVIAVVTTADPLCP